MKWPRHPPTAGSQTIMNFTFWKFMWKTSVRSMENYLASSVVGTTMLGRRLGKSHENYNMQYLIYMMGLGDLFWLVEWENISWKSWFLNLRSLALCGFKENCLKFSKFFFLIFKKHKNGVRLVMVDKYLFWIYKGAIIMKIKWSSPDHVSAIEINLGENDKFVANFHVFWFFRKKK